MTNLYNSLTERQKEGTSANEVELINKVVKKYFDSEHVERVVEKVVKGVSAYRLGQLSTIVTNGLITNMVGRRAQQAFYLNIGEIDDIDETFYRDGDKENRMRNWAKGAHDHKNLHEHGYITIEGKTRQKDYMLSALCYRVAFFIEYLKLDEGEVIVDVDDWNRAYESFAHDLYNVMDQTYKTWLNNNA